MGKDIDKLILVDGIKYSEEHLWAKKTGDMIQIGVTDYAQDQIGRINSIKLPKVGRHVNKGDKFADITTLHDISKLYMPLSGKVVAANETLKMNPLIINKDPYEKGWLVVIKPNKQKEFDGLLDKNAYIEML